MKKPILFLTALCCLLTACEDVEKKANEKLQLARQAYETGQYNEAKTQIDSIKILYPKAFDARRAGLYLMQDIELAEQQQTLTYLDSLLQIHQTELENLKNHFVLEKDTAYQQIGHYLAPAQVIEKNLHRSYLRFQTDQTPASKDSYETSNLGEQIEKADYKLGEDGGVILFISQHKDQNLHVTYTGDRTYGTTLSRADRQAAADVYQLSQLLTSITQLKKNKEEAQRKIRFVQENIKKRKTVEEE